MANEGKVVGNVVVLEGIAFAENASGDRRQLKFGDPVFEGDVLVTSAGARVEIAFDQGGRFLLRSRETVTLDSTVFGNLLPDGGSAALLPRVEELTRILNAISEGSALDRLLQETSSGVNPFSGVGFSGIRSDDGNSFVQLLRTAEALAPLTYEFASLDRQVLGYLPIGGEGQSGTTPGLSNVGGETIVGRLFQGLSVFSAPPAPPVPPAAPSYRTCRLGCRRCKLLGLHQRRSPSRSPWP